MNRLTTNSFNWRTAWVCLAIIVAFYGAGIAWRVARHDGNLTALFCIGDRYPIPPLLADQRFYVHRDWVGYDGQFYLFLAYDPLLRTDLPRGLDKPAYRSQRIGLPMLASMLSFGNESRLPYALFGSSIALFLMGCGYFLKILHHFRASAWWVLGYALSPGFLAAELRGTVDAASTSLIFIAIWELLKGRWFRCAVVLCAGALVREQTVLMSMAIAFWAVIQKQPRKALAFLMPAAVISLWGYYVSSRLGEPGMAMGAGLNLNWPMLGIVEKYLVVLPRIRSAIALWPLVVVVEIVFNLGLLIGAVLAVKRLEAAPRDWVSLCLAAYAVLAISLSSLPWCRFWDTARVLDLLVLLPLLVYLQTREKKYLVPLACSLPVSVLMFFSPR